MSPADLGQGASSAYDTSAASFELLVRRALGQVPEHFVLERCRVTTESTDGKGQRWTTVGVHTNVLEASLEALQKSISYMLYQFRETA